MSTTSWCSPRSSSSLAGSAMPTRPTGGCGIDAWYGFRLFTNHWDNDARVDDLEEILAVEEHAGRRDPYRSLCALAHTLAIRHRRRDG